MTDTVRDRTTGTLVSWSMTADTTAPVAASQQFAMAPPLDEPTGSSDEELQRRSRRGARDEVFSRLARPNYRQGGAQLTASTPLHRMQAVAIDRAVTEVSADLPRLAQRS